MADGKWIHDLTATTPLADSARHVLTVRLEVVRDHLHNAVHEWAKDAEHVHQLRVGTRRARAALDIFAVCLPDKSYKDAKKRLRGIRRGAGEARDWDVFLAGLATLEQAKGSKARRRGSRSQAKAVRVPSAIHLTAAALKKARPGFDFLIGYAMGQRLRAQTQLQETVEDFPFCFDRFVADTVAAVSKPDQPHLRTLDDLARPTLTALLTNLSHAANENLDDYSHLHQVRILGKRLRYAMEIFADCFPPAFRNDLYPAVEAMQDILGNANDSHVAYGRLSALSEKLSALLPRPAKHLRPGLDALLRYHQDRLPLEQERFRAWWDQWQQAGRAALFAKMLQGPAVA